jgi:hypothetical protein
MAYDAHAFVQYRAAGRERYDTRHLQAGEGIDDNVFNGLNHLTRQRNASAQLFGGTSGCVEQKHLIVAGCGNGLTGIPAKAIIGEPA